MDIKFLLDIAGVSFEILIAYLFFRIFLIRWQFEKRYVAAIFLLVFVLKFSSSYLLDIAWMKTCWSFLCYLMLACSYRGTIVKRITMTCFLMIISCLPEYAVHAVLMIFAGEVYATGVNALQDYALGMLLSKLIEGFLCSFLYYCQLRRKDNSLKDLHMRWYLAFFIYPSVTILVMVQNYHLILDVDQIEYVRNFLFSGVLMILSNIIIFQILTEIHRLKQKELYAELAEQQLIVQEKHYTALIEKNTAIKKHIHDTKNFLLVLQSYLKQNKSNQALEQIEGMLDNLGQNQMEYTGSAVLDTVLSAKIHEAEKQKIKLVPAIAMYEQLYIRTIDLALLLGNALDNAIEATAKITDEAERKIHLIVKSHQSILHIRVINSIAEPVMIERNAVQTSKLNRDMHGFGIPSMKSIVEQYNGTFFIESTESTFILNIVLENQEK